MKFVPGLQFAAAPTAAAACANDERITGGQMMNINDGQCSPLNPFTERIIIISPTGADIVFIRHRSRLSTQLGNPKIVAAAAVEAAASVQCRCVVAAYCRQTRAGCFCRASEGIEDCLFCIGGSSCRPGGVDPQYSYP